MKRISFISNTSVQYYRFESEIDLDFGRNNKLFYSQPFDSNILRFTYSSLIKKTVDGIDSFYYKQELIDRDYLVNNKIKENADLSLCQIVNESYYEVGNLRNALKKFKKKWIPLPFFKHNAINQNVFYPIDWVRCYFDVDDDFSKIKVVLLVDTTLTEMEDDILSPKLSLNPEENVFKLDTSEGMIQNFLLTGNEKAQWVEEYISNVFYHKNEHEMYEEPFNDHIGNYLLLLNFLQSLKNTPEIQLFTEDVRKIPVDLVIDLGNSSTCALLFENNQQGNFSFDKVKKLVLTDYSDPTQIYDEPFPMNLIFTEPKFGNIKSEKYNSHKFKIPSFVRLGKEAKRLIDESVIELNLGRELHSYNSSPKRYLWDKNISEFEWDYFPNDLTNIKSVYLNGLSEQLKSDGSVATDGVFGSQALFSKNSLLKFAFLEIINHAFVQINSIAYRTEHANMTMPRFIKRITISCPTAMIQSEQITLREAALEACQLLNNFIRISNFSTNNTKNWFEIPEIIPSISDLKKKAGDLDTRVDWNYDEATAAQMVFAYSLFSQKLNAQSSVINDLLLKGKDSLTIGSIDIGAGTTDIMIAKHYLKSGNIVVDKLKPLFWESFKIAGDDLLKELIQQIVIEGVIKSENDSGCSGVIENYARQNGLENVGDKLSGFFGEDSNNIGYIARMMRKAFVNQIAIPVCYKYLSIANQNTDNYLTTEEILGRPFKNQELVNYFTKHFGFSFLDIKWRLNSKKVNDIVEAVFSKLIGQLSLILNECKCDYVVLSGRPASLSAIENSFRNYLGTDPDRLVNLNNYWIGKWFPFSDNKGYVDNPKTIVAVGTLISLMGGKLNHLGSFKIDNTDLKTTDFSTVNNIVVKNFNGIDNILTPKKAEGKILINKIPFNLGYTRVDSRNYPINQIFSISFSDFDILQNYKTRYPNQTEAHYRDRVARFKSDLLLKMPLTISLSRDFDENKEILSIDNIETVDGDDLSIKSLKINTQSLENEKGYWLDTCEFVLNVRN